MVLFVLIVVSAGLMCVEGSPWDFFRIFRAEESPINLPRNRVAFRKPSSGSTGDVPNIFTSHDKEKSKSIEEKAVRPTPQWLKDMETRFLNHEQFKDNE